MRLSLYNTTQHRKSDTRLNVRKQHMVVLMEGFSRLQKVLAEKTSTGLEISEGQLLMMMSVVHFVWMKETT